MTHQAPRFATREEIEFMLEWLRPIVRTQLREAGCADYESLAATVGDGAHVSPDRLNDLLDQQVGLLLPNEIREGWLASRHEGQERI